MVDKRLSTTPHIRQHTVRYRSFLVSSEIYAELVGRTLSPCIGSSRGFVHNWRARSYPVAHARIISLHACQSHESDPQRLERCREHQMVREARMAERIRVGRP